MLKKWGLPVRWGADPACGSDLAHAGAVEQVWSAMMSDKKRQDGRLRLVLPEAIGRVRLVDGVHEDAIKRALAELQ